MSIFIDNSATILNDTSNSLTFKTTANAANVEFMLGSNDESTNIIVKDNQVVPGILHRIPASGQYLTKNSLHPKINLVSHNTVGPQTYLATDIINTIITRNCNGGARIDNLPSANNIISAIPNCQVGSSFTCLIRNTTLNHILTIDDTATSISLQDVKTIAPENASRWIFTITDVGTPAISGYLSDNVKLTTYNTISVSNGTLNLTGLTNGFPMRRENNTGTPWTFSMYFKANSSIGAGNHNLVSAGLITLSYNRANKNIAFKYGDAFNSLTKTTATNSILDDIWYHIVISLDTGDLGVQSAQLSTYYGRMKVYINSTESTDSETHSNFGINPATNQFTTLTIGSNIGHIAWITIDDNVRLQAGINNLYNSGTFFNLNTLGNDPEYWWQFETTDVSPNIVPTIGTGNLVMASGTFDTNIYPAA